MNSSTPIQPLSSRFPAAGALLAAVLFLTTGAAGAAEPGAVAVRFLDEPIDDLRAYSEEAVSLSQRTAPASALAAVAERSASTSDVLLLPYYEVDRKNPNGATTLFAIHNETGREQPVRILYLTAVGAEEQKVQEIRLAPHASRTINVRDVRGLEVDADGKARGLVILGVIGGVGDSSDLLSGDFFFIDSATGYATGNTLLNTSLDDSGNELCAEWGTRFLRGGAFGGASRFRFVVDVPGGSQEIDPPTAVGTIYDEAGRAVRSFELRTNLYTFELTSDELIPADTPFGSLSVRFAETRGALLVEHSGFETLSIAFKAACRDSVE
jgi:hypothetical protein